ncbi:MAG: hypothetical protein L6V93_15510 [Clostridiales bacterium]|nr:MAG: hypothetical protein L6V93_15510 [Clostridiales bacterium]
MTKTAEKFRKSSFRKTLQKSQHRAQRTFTGCTKNETHKAIADVLTLEKEDAPSGEYEIFDPEHTWKRKTITDFFMRKKPFWLRFLTKANACMICLTSRA